MFEPFSSNFPFSVQDLLRYSQEPGAVKSPVRLFVVEKLPQAPEKTEPKKTEVGDVQVSKQLVDEVISDKNEGEAISSRVTPSSVSTNSITITDQDKEKSKEILGINQVKPKGKMTQAYTPPAPVTTTPDKVPVKMADKVPDKVEKIPEKVEGKVNVGV